MIKIDTYYKGLISGKINRVTNFDEEYVYLHDLLEGEDYRIKILVLNQNYIQCDINGNKVDGHAKSMIKPIDKANEFYNTFYSALGKNGRPNHLHDHAIECSKACVDKLLIELTGNKERIDFYIEVRMQIELLE